MSDTLLVSTINQRSTQSTNSISMRSNLDATQRRGITDKLGSLTKTQGIVSVRRKTGIWTDKIDPDYFERGALICFPANKQTGELDRNKIMVIDKDQMVILSSDSPITIGEPVTCTPLEPIEGDVFGEFPVEVEGQFGVTIDDAVVGTPYIPDHPPI